MYVKFLGQKQAEKMAVKVDWGFIQRFPSPPRRAKFDKAEFHAPVNLLRVSLAFSKDIRYNKGSNTLGRATPLYLSLYLSRIEGPPPKRNAPGSNPGRDARSWACL